MRVLFLVGCFCFAVSWYKCHYRYLAVLAAALGIWFVRYFDAVRTWISSLGTDSFSEAQRFDWSEASFFLKTLSSVLVPASSHKWLETIGIAAIVVAVLMVALHWLTRRSQGRPGRQAVTYATLLLGGVGMGTAVSYPISQVSGQVRSNSALYEGVRAHFQGNAEQLSLTRQTPTGMRVVVYLGESTTAMHWGLYGYPIQTTPRLQAFAAKHPGFLQFNHVMPTHTHTSTSLLQALSFRLRGESDYRQIYDIRRASLVDVLTRAGIPSLLLSTQGATGTFNLASSIIFSQVTERHFANPGSVLLGNLVTADQVPDDVFFRDAIRKFQAFHPGKSAVAFLHSYAGHGPYAKNLPESVRQPLDPMLQAALPEDLFGGVKEAGLTEDLADYDSAMRYVDANIAHVMDQAAAAVEPTVVLYFSDHGESVATGRGHDSSRVQHEMLRVPFLMYFNDAARDMAPDLYARFQAASRADRPATLAQVPGTVMTLLGYRVQGTGDSSTGVGLDAAGDLVPVLVRGAQGHVSYIRSHGAERTQQSGTVDVTDPATEIWLNRRAGLLDGQHPALCYADASTWGKANRGSMVADCLAVSLDLRNGQLDAVPDGSGWALRAAARMAASRGVTLRLDAGTLPAGPTCEAMQTWIRQDFPEGLPVASQDANPWVLELASDQHQIPASCAQLQAQGVDLFVRVPANLSDADQAADWAASVTRLGWPIHYGMTSAHDLSVLPALLAHTGAQWALSGISTDALPWQPADHGVPAGIPTPTQLTVDTRWDVNSRGTP